MKFIELKKKELNEYLVNEYNKNIYTYYHEYLKPNFSIDINLQNYFHSIYNDVKFFKENYLKLPYETNEYFEKKLDKINQNNFVEESTKLYIIYHILYLITLETRYDEKGKLQLHDNYYFDNKTHTFKLRLNTEIVIKYPKLIAPQKTKKNSYWYYEEVIETLYKYIESSLGYEFDYYRYEKMRFALLKELGEINTNKTINKTNQVIQKQIIKINDITPNLRDRYKILCDLLNFEDTTLNISNENKYKLLATILDCSVVNARHIINGKYHVISHEKEINKYIDNLKK